MGRVAFCFKYMSYLTSLLTLPQGVTLNLGDKWMAQVGSSQHGPHNDLAFDRVRVIGLAITQ